MIVGLPVEAVEAAFGPALRDELVVSTCRFLTAPSPWDDVAAALIRPDGYLGWATHEVTSSSAAAAAAALGRWLAWPPRSASQPARTVPRPT